MLLKKFTLCITKLIIPVLYSWKISLGEIFLLILPPALIGKINYWPVLMIIHNVKVAGLGKFISCEYYNNNIVLQCFVTTWHIRHAGPAQPSVTEYPFVTFMQGYKIVILMYYTYGSNNIMLRCLSCHVCNMHAVVYKLTTNHTILLPYDRS